MGSVSLINGHIDDDDRDYKSCDDCISCKVCHAVKLASKMMHADVLCEHFIDKDLINRQKAEIESNKAKIKISAECIARQDKEIERLQNDLNTWKDIAHRETSYVSIAKADAIKEFAERLKEEARTIDDDYSPNGETTIIEVEDIDNLVKEMVGDTDV